MGPHGPRPAPAAHAAMAAEVIDLWTEIGLRPASPDDDFFVLGGQSLTLVRFLALVHERYGVELPIDALFASDLTARVAADAIVNAQLDAADDSELAAALAELDGLDDDQITALLAGEA